MNDEHTNAKADRRATAPLLAAIGFLSVNLSLNLGGPTRLTALAGRVDLTMYRAVIAVGAFPFGTNLEQRPVDA